MCLCGCQVFEVHTVIMDHIQRNLQMQMVFRTQARPTSKATVTPQRENKKQNKTNTYAFLSQTGHPRSLAHCSFHSICYLKNGPHQLIISELLGHQVRTSQQVIRRAQKTRNFSTYKLNLIQMRCYKLHWGTS